jgi:hypothetical protein
MKDRLINGDVLPALFVWLVLLGNAAKMTWEEAALATDK